MKTIRLFSITALALMMAACTSNEIEVPQPDGKMHFTATVAAPSSDSATKTVYTESGSTINVAWKEGDEIAFIHHGVKDVVTVGTPNSDGSAPISGDITVGTDGEAVALVYPAASVKASGSGAGFTPDMTYAQKGSTQDGTLDYISTYLDARQGTGELSVSGSMATLKESVKMESKIAIWKLMLTDGINPINAKTVALKLGAQAIAGGADVSGKSTYYLCVVPASLTTIYTAATAYSLPTPAFTIEASNGTDTYTLTRSSQLSLIANKFYQSTVTMSRTPQTYDLKDISSPLTLKDGDVLTGTLINNVKISIAAGATVTLDNVSINADGTLPSSSYAGITCEGDATIILKDGSTNAVKGFSNSYPGIYIPKDYLLTIQGETAGTGELEASSGSSSGNASGAGIGGGYQLSCGNIEIQGGVIKATGSINAAGIGSGYGTDVTCGYINIKGGKVTATGHTGIGSGPVKSTCGDILITGGIITATGNPGAGIGSGKADLDSENSTCGNIEIKGGDITATGGNSSAGIGSGWAKYGNSVCGDITIGKNVTNVKAMKTVLSGATYCIGKGEAWYAAGNSNCGTVIFDTVTMYDGSTWKERPTTGESYGGLTLTISNTTYKDDTWTLN